jgi:hypothetical protein
MSIIKPEFRAGMPTIDKPEYSIIPFTAVNKIGILVYNFVHL